ncbi:MAG: hypothetical protein NVS1B13_00780 [Flavisolibacter sp.]
MKVTGFSFIKDAIKFQYPIVEALQSILPLCDEIIVAVGQSQDNTRELIAGINASKIKILDTKWDEQSTQGGRVLAEETDKAFKAIGEDSDWCFYIQGDEVLHEAYYDTVYQGMKRWKDEKNVDGLLFSYRHFYGSYDYVGSSSKWYPQEIRVIRKDFSIYSYRDAQGFRKGNNQKLRVKPLNAFIHHYGWVREPKAMFAKSKDFSKHWSGPAHDSHIYTGEFDYSKIDALEKFYGTHPAVMKNRIDQVNWKFHYDPSFNNLSIKEKAKNVVEKITGKRPFDYKNYIII